MEQKVGSRNKVSNQCSDKDSELLDSFQNGVWPFQITDLKFTSKGGPSVRTSM